MSPIKIEIAITAASDVNMKTLKLGPTRMVKFLQAVTDSAIRAGLAPAGWSEEHADEACALIHDLQPRSDAAVPADEKVARAMTSCEEWQSSGLSRFRAMLQMTHPAQATFLFHDFTPSKGIEAVLTVGTFIERRHALEKSADRKESRKADHDALAMLERCGATPEELKKRKAEVDLVMTSMSAEVADNSSEEQRLHETLQKIYVWITAWSEIARTTTLSRKQLIRLGVAKRRSHKAAPPAPAPTPPAPAPPVVVAPVVTPPVVVAPPIAPSRAAPLLARSTELDEAPNSRAA